MLVISLSSFGLKSNARRCLSESDMLSMKYSTSMGDKTFMIELESALLLLVLSPLVLTNSYFDSVVDSCFSMSSVITIVFFHPDSSNNVNAIMVVVKLVGVMLSFSQMLMYNL